MPRVWLVILLGLFQLVPRAAHAEGSQLAWQGPACRDSQAAFEQRLATLVKPADAARLSGSVAVTARSGGFDVKLSLALGARPLGERKFQAGTCQAAAETAAVAAAMAAFSEDAAAPAVAERPASPDESGAWTRKRDPEPDFTRERARPSVAPVRAQPRVGLLAFAQAGVLPSVAVGGALELGIGVGRRWSLALQGGLSGEQERSHGNERNSYLRLLFGAARGCFAPYSSESARVDACAGVQLLWIRGRGEGFDIDRSASLFTAAPLLALDFSRRAPEFLEWRLQAEGSVPVSRQRFLVDGREVARASALTFSARLGPVVRF